MEAEKVDMVHVWHDGGAICGLRPVDLKVGDSFVSVTSAVDPEILKVTCPLCCARIGLDLSKG